MRKWRSPAWFIASIPAWSFRSHAAMPPPLPPPPSEPQDPVKLRPLNLPGDNLFAAHRSHSSHSSHRSSSRGSYSVPPPARAPSMGPVPAPRAAPEPRATPVPAPAVPQRLVPSGPNEPVDPGRPAVVSPRPAPLVGTPAAPALTLTEKRRLQIMRVQIALTSLGIYTGAINGVLTNETKEAIKLLQIVKGLPETGLMTTETLNALGVPAVQ